MTTRPASAQRLRDLARLHRVRDRIDREYAHPPAVDPGINDDERRTIFEMMAKGTHDLDGTFERMQGSDAEVVQEPTERPYGVRDCAFRDPAGNLIRIQVLR